MDVLQLANEGQTVARPMDALKDPYVLESDQPGGDASRQKTGSQLTADRFQLSL